MGRVAGDRRHWPGVQSSDRDSEPSPGRVQDSCLHPGSTVEAKRDRVIIKIPSQMGNPLLIHTCPERKLRPDFPSIGMDSTPYPMAWLTNEWVGHFGFG